MPKVESNAAIEALEKKKMNAAHWCVASLAIGLVGGMAPVFLMPWDDPWSTVVLGIFVITMMIGLIGNAVRIVKYDLQQKMCRVDMEKGASRRNAAPNEMVLTDGFLRYRIRRQGEVCFLRVEAYDMAADDWREEEPEQRFASRLKLRDYMREKDYVPAEADWDKMSDAAFLQWWREYEKTSARAGKRRNGGHSRHPDARQKA